jgi:hypothetical protein
VQIGLPEPSWQQVLVQQLEPHNVEPVGQENWHTPPSQICPPVQVDPLVAGGPALHPQWAGSFCSSTQIGLPAPSSQQVLAQQVEPQRLEPVGHDAVHAPKMQTFPPVH